MKDRRDAEPVNLHGEDWRLSAARSSDRSLEQADRVNDRADRQRGEIDQRASQIEKLNEWDDRIRDIMQKQMGERER